MGYWEFLKDDFFFSCLLQNYDSHAGIGNGTGASVVDILGFKENSLLRTILCILFFLFCFVGGLDVSL